MRKLYPPHSGFKVGPDATLNWMIAPDLRWNASDGYKNRVIYTRGKCRHNELYNESLLELRTRYIYQIITPSHLEI